MSTQQAILTSPNYLRRSLQNHHWDLTHFTFPIHLNYMSPYYIEKKWKERLRNWILNFCDKLPSDFLSMIPHCSYEITLKFMAQSDFMCAVVVVQISILTCELQYDEGYHLISNFSNQGRIFEKDYTFFNFSCRFPKPKYFFQFELWLF